MRISASRLATVLAARLDSRVPRPFQVRANGRGLVVDHPDGWGLEMRFDWIEDEAEDRGASALAEIIIWSALSNVQDAVSEASTEPWPEVAERRMALPGTRHDSSQVYFWYGASEHSAVITFEPISMADVMREP